MSMSLVMSGIQLGSTHNVRLLTRSTLFHVTTSPRVSEAGGVNVPSVLISITLESKPAIFSPITVTCTVAESNSPCPSVIV